MKLVKVTIPACLGGRKLAVFAALATLVCAADTITVAQGETQNITAAATVTAMEVHGTLNLQGTASAAAELTFDPKETKAYLGSAAGDNAVINIGDYGRIKAGRFMVGGPGGVGGFVIGGKRKNNGTGAEWDGATGHLATGQLTLAPDATSPSGVIDVLTLNPDARAGFTQSNGRQGLVNRSTSADMRVLFNGGIFYRYNGFENFPFTTAYDSRFPDVVLQGEGGRLIILESVNGNPINITSVNGGSVWVAHGNACFRGQGDVILHSTDNTHIANWFWNLSSGCWENNGDLRLTGSMRMTMQGTYGLPKATTNGIVQVLGNQKCYLDLNGKEQGVNGLVVSGSAMLTNANAAACSLILGAGKPDGVLSVKKVECAGPITAVKQGAGTLTVTNTPYFPAMRVEKGKVLFKDDDCTLGALTTYLGSTVVVDRCTLTLNALTNDCATFECVNGGKLHVTVFGSGLGENLLADDSSAIALASDITKAGAGTATLHQESALDANVHVAAGTLAFARPGTTNHWLRFTFTKMYSGNFQLSEIELMNVSGSRVDGGGGTVNITSGVGAGTGGSLVANADANCAPQDMVPQSVWASDQGWLLNEPNGGYRDRSPSALFDGQSWTRLRYSTAPSAANPKVFVVRMPANTAETYQYNFRVGYSGSTHPSAWKVETSPDGVNWTDSDAHGNVTPPSSPSRAYYNGGVHYRLMSGRDGAAGLAAGANVQVDRGATLDCSRVTGGQTVSSLTVDCAGGMGDGTLVNVAFAAAGEVRLVNFPADTPLVNFELPLVFTDAADLRNVRGWTLYVDGVATTKKLSYMNGRLVCLPQGTVLLFR